MQYIYLTHNFQSGDIRAILLVPMPSYIVVFLVADALIVCKTTCSLLINTVIVVTPEDQPRAVDSKHALKRHVSRSGRGQELCRGIGVKTTLCNVCFF